MKPRILSIILVAVQVILIASLVISTPLQWLGLGAMIWILAAILLMGWAWIAMRKSLFSVFPEPREKAKLVTSGPYRYIRHPMYTAVLLGCGGLVQGHFTWLRLCMFILLIAVLVIKLNFEESLLVKKFDKYKAYSRMTSRLIPGVY